MVMETTEKQIAVRVGREKDKAAEVAGETED